MKAKESIIKYYPKENMYSIFDLMYTSCFRGIALSTELIDKYDVKTVLEASKEIWIKSRCENRVDLLLNNQIIDSLLPGLEKSYQRLRK